MRIGPFTIAFTKSLPMRPVPQAAGRGWFRVNEPYTGAWQLNDEITVPMVAASPAVYSCVTLIASDVAKLGLRLVAQDDDGIWHETRSSAFSPVLKKPNRYQNRIKFVEHWITSKLLQGNTYVLKQRDARGVVVAMYILEPTKVTPLVAQNGDVYYQLTRDDLSELERDVVTVPASEMIHDRMVALYHPLVGVSPIHACGVAALQGLSIQQNSRNFFANGSSPGGILTAPGAISNETADRLKAKWSTDFSGDNAGKVAVLGDGLKYEQLAVNAADSQLIEQLKWTADTVCSCFHVQPYMISVGPPPPYANVEPLLLQYYSQCLQSLIENLELCLDEGLELPAPYGTEVDLDDLMRMDSMTRTNSAQTAITSGGMAINEARRKYLGLGPLPGGETPYMQQQMWPLNQLANRAIPAVPAAPAPPPADKNEDPAELDDEKALAWIVEKAGGVTAFAAALDRQIGTTYALLDDLAAVVATRIKESRDRCDAMEREILRTKAEVELMVTREISRDRERLAALEARPPAPGPPGADGAPGRDGTPGPKGDPGMVYRGVYQDATAYALGDVVTWAGGAWHCNEATTDRPGDGSHVWTLIVKRGRDAKGAR